MDAKKKMKRITNPKRRVTTSTKVTLSVPDEGAVNCDECSARLEPVTLTNYDFSAWAGMHVILKSAPGYRCSGCGGETIPGVVVNASLAAVALAFIGLPHRLPAQHARYVRRSLGITQNELADRMGIARETVAQWECGEREISPQHDLILRGVVIERVHGQHPAAVGMLEKMLPILGAVRSAPPPRRMPTMPPVSLEPFLHADGSTRASSVSTKRKNPVAASN